MTGALHVAELWVCACVWRRAKLRWAQHAGDSSLTWLLAQLELLGLSHCWPPAVPCRHEQQHGAAEESL